MQLLLAIKKVHIADKSTNVWVSSGCARCGASVAVFAAPPAAVLGTNPLTAVIARTVLSESVSREGILPF